MNIKFILLFFLTFCFFKTFSQKSQLQTAQNVVGKLKLSVNNNDDAKKQLLILADGIKAIELAEKDNKTKNWPETYAIKAYLSAYISLIDLNENNANKHYDLAVEAVSQAIKLDKFQNNSELINAATHNINIKKQQYGNKAFTQNDYFTTFKLLKEVSDYFPKDTSIAVNVAISAQNIKNYDAALIYFNNAKQNKVKNPAVYQNIAQLYLTKFESNLALKTLEEGLALNPKHYFLTNDYINLLLDNYKYTKATQVIENSLANNKINEVLYFLYGFLQQTEFNNHNTAGLAYKKVLDIDQNNFEALYQIGIAYINIANTLLKQKETPNYLTQVNTYLSFAELALLHANEININDRPTIQLLIEIYKRKNKLDKVAELNKKLDEF